MDFQELVTIELTSSRMGGLYGSYPELNQYYFLLATGKLRNNHEKNEWKGMK